jgi:dienelactone hydrolase
MAIVARRVTLEQDGIPGYMAHPEGPETRPGIMMVHHAHGVTADYKIDAYRLAQLGYNVLAPDFFNMFGVPGTDHIGAGADLQAKHGDTEFLVKMDEAWQSPAPQIVSASSISASTHSTQRARVPSLG